MARRDKARRKRPRRTFRLTREGKVFLAVSVGVGLAAVNTGNNLLYLVLGLLLSLLLLSGVLSDLALLRMRVERRLPERFFAKTPALVELVLENGKRRLPSFSLEAEDRAEGESNERRCYFLKVAPGAEQIAAYRRAASRRGVLRFTGYRLATRYPFGLIEKGREVALEAEALVYPELVEVPPLPVEAPASGTERPSGRRGPGHELGGIREYNAGDEARTIHWRRTAALARLVVRERERDALSRVTLVLDNAAADPEDEAFRAGFERAISECASHAADVLARGAAVEVVVRGSRSPTVLPGGAPDPIWAFLARLEAVPLDEAPPIPSTGRGRAHRVAVTPVDAPEAA